MNNYLQFFTKKFRRSFYFWSKVSSSFIVTYTYWKHDEILMTFMLHKWTKFKNAKCIWIEKFALRIFAGNFFTFDKSSQKLIVHNLKRFKNFFILALPNFLNKNKMDFKKKNLQLIIKITRDQENNPEKIL